MTEAYQPASPSPEPPATRADQTLGSSSLYRLCEEVIALRELNNRQHKVFEQTLVKVRDALQASFNSFAADTQRAYQQLRQEIHGDKRVSLALLNELLDIGLDLEQLVAARPSGIADCRLQIADLPSHLQSAICSLQSTAEALGRWADAVEVEARKVQAALRRHGIQSYDAVVGSPYNPALHERIGSRRMEGMDPLRVAEQRQRGYASQQPEFVLRRPKVIITE
jgi:molecular chaperone GrpE (heat shock protein)